MEDNQELMKELFTTMYNLAQRWGSGTETPFGKIAVAAYNQCTWHEGRGISSATISIHKCGDEYWAKKTHSYQASTDDLVRLGKQLASMTQYFAGQDFQRKVKGSISLLKRINEALQGK